MTIWGGSIFIADLHLFHTKGNPFYDRQVQQAFKKVLFKAGITDFHVHDLRHTFASYLRQMGFDLHNRNIAWE
jgi:integrase